MNNGFGEKATARSGSRLILLLPKFGRQTGSEELDPAAERAKEAKRLGCSYLIADARDTSRPILQNLGFIGAAGEKTRVLRPALQTSKRPGCRISVHLCREVTEWIESARPAPDHRSPGAPF